MTLQARLHRLGNWIESLKAAVTGDNGFVHRSVICRHPGLLVNQEQAAKAIDEAIRLAEASSSCGAIYPLLPRVSVVLRPSSPLSASFPASAFWTGGLFDRGVVLLRKEEGWQGKLVEHLAALLLREAKYGTEPDIDIPLS